MKVNTRKKMVVMGTLFLFIATTLFPGIYAHITDFSPEPFAHEKTKHFQELSDDQYKIMCHICTIRGPIQSRSLVVENKEDYDELQMILQETTQAAGSYSGSMRPWLYALEDKTNTLLNKLEDIGLIRNEMDKQMIRNQIHGGHKNTLERLWEHSAQDNETINNSICLIAGYGTENTRIEFPLRNPFLLSIARVTIQILELLLAFDFALASQILNYLSTDNILNLAIYSKFIINETRALPPPWVGVYTYSLNEYQEVKGNCETTLLGFAGLVIEFYVGIGNIFGIDATGLVGFSGYATMTPET